MSDGQKLAEAWSEWKAVNKIAFDASTLGTDDPDRYLESRLWRAFMDGATVGSELAAPSARSSEG